MNQASEHVSRSDLPQRAADHFRPAVLALLLFALTLGVFLPAIGNDFLYFDDADYVTANRHVQDGITAGGFLWAFTSVEASNWHPLTWLSHMLDCQVFGVRPWGHHLTSVLLHALNASLLFLCLRRLTGATWRSFIVAALFALHPLRVESVAWIAERKDVLSGLFWILTLWSYGEYVRRRGPDGNRFNRFYAASLGSFCLGLMAKPMLVTLPCVLLLLDYWPLRRWAREGVGGLIREKVPFLLAAIVSSGITYAVQSQYGAVNLNTPLGARLMNVAVSYCRYLGKTLWPVDLTLAYPYLSQSLLTVLLAASLLAAVSLGAFYFRRRFPFAFVGWFWFVGTLVPVIGIIQVGAQSMADRYTYIPSIGIALLVTWSVAEGAGNGRRQTILSASGATAVLVLCAGLTFRQIRYWRNDVVLFRHALMVTRDNSLAHFCLGAALHKRGDLEGALDQYRQCLAIDPTFPSAREGLGLIFMSQGHLDEAIGELRAASQRRPNQPLMHYHLGLALDRSGDLDGALAEYRRALELDAGLAEAHNDLGVLCGRLGQSDEAIRHFAEASRLQPRNAEFHYNLGNALARSRQIDAAIGQLLEAVRLDPDHCDAHNNLGVLLSRKGLWSEAAAQFRIVLSLKPDHAEAQKNLQTALSRAGGQPGP